MFAVCTRVPVVPSLSPPRLPLSHITCLLLPVSAVSRVSTLLCRRSLPARYKHLHSVWRPPSEHRTAQQHFIMDINWYWYSLKDILFYSSFKRHFHCMETGNQRKRGQEHCGHSFESAPLFSRNGLNILTSLTIPWMKHFIVTVCLFF